METKICPSCGNAIDIQLTYCSYCGAAQMPNTRADAYPPEPTPQQWPRQEAPAQYSEAPVYTPPIPQMFRYQGEEGIGGGWIVFLRVMLWIFFSIIVLAYSIAGISMIVNDLPGEGIAILLVGVLAAFLLIAGGMVSLNSASNQRKTATNTAKILQVLQEQSKK